jgi:hypothetical protein
MSSPPPPPGSSSAPAARSQLLRGETSSEHHRPVPSSTSASAVLPRRLDRLWHPLEAYSPVGSSTRPHLGCFLYTTHHRSPRAFAAANGKEGSPILFSF